MAKLISLFTKSSHAKLYSQFRFKPPVEILEKITKFLEIQIKRPFKLAVDAACGSGQSTLFLSPHFENVIGFDVSEAQIKEALNHNTTSNITYKVGTAAEMSLPDESVQLITASQCHHWFDLPRFYDEVQRVLVPEGVLSMYWYTLPVLLYKDKDEALRELVEQIYTVDTAKYWHERRKIVDRGFNDLEFPFRDIVKEEVYSDVPITAAGYAGYIKTWSAYQLMKKAEPEAANKVLEKFYNRVREITEEDKPMEEIKFTLRFRYYLIIGRK